MSNIDLVYLPVIGRGEQINIICEMHDISVNYLHSSPMGNDFDKDTLSLGVNMHSKEKVTMYKPG